MSGCLRLHGNSKSQIPMPSFSLILKLLPLLVIAWNGASVHGSDGAPLFAVKYEKEGVSFSGVVPDEETGLELAQSVKSVRPDLKIINEGVRTDPNVDFPNTHDLTSLLAEIGISTHEGGLAIWDDALLLSGLTDSVITITALKIRMEPILGNREIINRICIVPTEDLPKISVKLSTGEEISGPLLDFEYYPTAAEKFEAPGLALEKLFPSMVMLADISKLDGTSPASPGVSQASAVVAPASSTGPLRAVPLMPGEKPAATSPLTPAIFRAVSKEPEPQNKYVHLEAIRFSRNSFLLQANQSALVAGIVKQLNTPPLAGNRVLIKPVKYGSSSGAYGEYLLEKRGNEARRLLAESGIGLERFSIQNTNSSEQIDAGEVQIIVEIPPPPPEPEPEEETTVTVAEGEAGEKEEPETQEE